MEAQNPTYRINATPEAVALVVKVLQDIRRQRRETVQRARDAVLASSQKLPVHLMTWDEYAEEMYARAAVNGKLTVRAEDL
jgi:hypothetical protein